MFSNDGRALRAAALALAIGGCGEAAASVYGTLSNFDVFNNSGGSYHGFEIELEGIALGDVPSYGGSYYTFTNWHYGAGTLSSYSGGVLVRYFDDGAHATTPYAGAILPTDGHTCITIDGCEHFGVALNGNPTNTRYYWLDQTGQRSQQVNLLAPSWDVQPAVPADGGAPAQPAVVRVQIEAPEVEPGQLRSDAIWVQMFKTELEQEVELDDLMADSDVVPDGDQGVTEIEWKLFQRDPSKPDQNFLDNGPDGEEVGEAVEQVLRTFRFYEFTGTYDPDHEAICLAEAGDCEDLASDGLSHLAYVGAPIGQQMAAVNLDGAILQPVPVPPSLVLLGAPLVLTGLRRRR